VKFLLLVFFQVGIILSAHSKEWIGLKNDPISIKCTSDNKVFTYIFSNETSVYIRQELYEWDRRYREPIKVEMYSQKEDLIEIEYSEITAPSKEEMDNQSISRGRMTIDRLTGIYTYRGINFFRHFNTESKSSSSTMQSAAATKILRHAFSRK
jgi:hypothetical protein